MKTRAAVLREMGAQRPYKTSQPLKIEELELDAPGHGEILVRVRAAGLCHSDLSVIDGNRPRPLPMALGHEAAGEVMEVGDGVTDLEVGDHVVFSFVPSCGTCDYCLDGRAALCAPGAAANNEGTLLGGGMRLHQNEHTVNHHLGVSGFAEYAVTSRRSAVKVNKDLPFDIAAVFGCAVLTGVGAVVHTAGLRAGQSVLVVGLGGVGLSAVLGAVAGGARQIIAADIAQDKLDMAKSLGATHVVNSRDEDAVEQVKAISGGGVDIAAEFAGVGPALEFAFAATGKGGKTVTAGLPHPSTRMAVSPVQLVAEERSLLGSYLGGHVPALDIPEYVALYLAGRLPVDKLLTHRLKLEDINEGFDRLADGEAIRQVILFD
ncbi:zinc-dependent alcohol dehydrogenase family protein [Alloalcanivorax xenomutans]|jgi:Zn-dependent alcohol dehydrogenase|uniref:Zinc-dependent alcohol dehydrogenase family protein n=1 Tax=Alloalcanivorax xenomutans TaxID=1094342 RepID=A0A9Q3W4C2_9GAMM|nr:zinc-dependent alcohol dehydrogenase family protein [Alloalcanivorax xenomutans]ERS10620.1 alcohol dehydrogenase [Alcanivorax sp. PN-3]KYZ84620.1 alcohol dehydrogenase [Alcanivorax sp. KX64203]MBA4720892.1 alcohol dehydrogenase catalytic domain-containing protein [Alcanivorax sp.]ARB44342.1 alcohol dehydrogenase [Alloalcanivorax xenomutans]MCE7508764.1 zinc-dependent alcohol dehydrogenase family protein [Alloalcanivorax xenomutans]